MQREVIGQLLYITCINYILREAVIQSEIHLFINVAKIISEFNDALQLTIYYIYQRLNKRKLRLNLNEFQILNNHKN